MDDKKRKSLEEVLAHIEKSYGKGSIINMGSTEKTKIDVILLWTALWGLVDYHVVEL